MARVVTSDAAIGLIGRLQQDIDQVQSAMDAMLNAVLQLGELRATVQRINDDIQMAGGGLG